MRMRKKKHLEERLESISELLFTSNLEDRNFNNAASRPEYIDFDKWFGRSAPIFLEIGCGKGGFAAELAKRRPEVNIIAVEKDANVIVAACETAKKAGLSNLRFMKCAAEYLPKYIPPHTADLIFLNFSCPFPKNKYSVHRLTHRRFLNIYRRLMKPYAEIHQKTDNMHFFEFSLEEFTAAGFALKNISLDLHTSDFEGNIETEYERKFVSLGMPIYRAEAYLPNGESEND